MQETEEKTTDVFYRFCKRDILKENGLRRNGKGRIRMKRAYFNCILLDGTEQMEPVAHKMVLVDGEKITAIVEDTAHCEGYEKVDLKGGYLMPGLINLHVHLAGNGKPSAKPRDNAALVRRILSNGLTRAMAYRLVCSYAKLELLGGVTTIRTVGGLADFDTRCRDGAAKGKILAPRILAANEGISVPGGHMAGSVAVAAHNNAEALAQLEKASAQKVDLVKLMITGGVLDATEKGTPGEMKMPPEMIKAVCDAAHALGYTVAAHTESPAGVKAALENGVDSITGFLYYFSFARISSALIPSASSFFRTVSASAFFASSAALASAFVFFASSLTISLSITFSEAFFSFRSAFRESTLAVMDAISVESAFLSDCFSTIWNAATMLLSGF